jgi:hypothetical protein
MRLIVALFFIVVSVSSFAKEETSNISILNGATKISNKTSSKKFIINGPLEVNDSHINKVKTLGSVKANNLTSNKIKISGSLNGQNLNSNKIEVTGATDLIDSSINNLKISGPLDATRLKAKEAVIRGMTTLAETNIDFIQINGQTTIKDHSHIDSIEACGYVQVQDSKVVNLKLDSDECRIHNSQIDNITFLDNSPQSKPSALKISGNSSINGKIIFKSGNGIVMLDKHLIKDFDISKIEGGRVIISPISD